MEQLLQRLVACGEGSTYLAWFLLSIYYLNNQFSFAFSAFISSLEDGFVS